MNITHEFEQEVRVFNPQYELSVLRACAKQFIEIVDKGLSSEAQEFRELVTRVRLLVT